MYMYNRNQPQSISQFIKGKILEEEDMSVENARQLESDLNTSESDAKKDNSSTKLDEDFMFQMDKGFLFI